MYVIGFSASTFSPATVPSATSPLNRERHGVNPWRAAIASIARKPILCR